MSLSMEETAALLDRSSLDERDCLAIINGDGDEDGPIDAYDLLLRKLGRGVERKFKSIDKALIALLKEVHEVFPDAEYYTASGGFHLMIGKSHNDKDQGQQELVALHGYASIGDGDF